MKIIRVKFLREVSQNVQDWTGETKIKILTKMARTKFIEMTLIIKFFFSLRPCAFIILHIFWHVNSQNRYAIKANKSNKKITYGLIINKAIKRRNHAIIIIFLIIS